METTVKRITLALTKEDLRMLEELCKSLGETQSAVLKRSLSFLFNHNVLLNFIKK